MAERGKFTVERILTGGAILASTLALAACGSKDPTSADKGSNVIPRCPAGFIDKGEKPVRSREAYSEALGAATTALSGLLPRNGFNNAMSVFPTSDNLNGLANARINAGHQVFYDHDNQFNLGAETRLDDLSEQLCASGNNLYASPQAATAIGAMRTARVPVEGL